MAQEYIHRTSIPTESEVDCLVFSDGVYFASHTNLFRIDKTTSSLFTTAEGTIRHCAVNKNNTFLCSDDRVFMNYQENTVGSLRRTATAVAANENIFVLGVGNILEIWNVPQEYKFTLFKRRARIFGHHGPISEIKIINDNEVLTAAEDNSIRIFNVSRHESTVLLSTRGRPVGIHTYEDGTLAAAAGAGAVTFFTATGEVTRQVDLGGKPVSASGCGDLLAVLMEVPAGRETEAREEDHFHFQVGVKVVETEGDNDPSKVDTSIIRPAYKRPETRSVLVLFRKDEEIYRAEIGHAVSRICMQGQEIAMRSKGFVGIFNISNEKFTFSVDLPRITTFSVSKGVIAAGCADGKARVYSNHVCRAVLYDARSKGDILDTFICENTCIVTYKSGYVSAFNVNDSNCYRSFSVNAEDLLPDFTRSAVTEDGSITFLANVAALFIVDMQRSRQVEKVKLDAPLVSLAFHRENLYYLDLKNKLTKYSYISGKMNELALESTGVGCAVRDGTVVVSSPAGLTFYDLDFNYVNGISISLDARHREEVFSKSKPVEFLDLDSRYVICGGQSNQIKIVRRGTPLSGDALSPNETVQTLRISKNRDWENYKERLGKEKRREFNKEHFIETRRIAAEASCFYALSREGILIFEAGGSLFNPVELSTEASPASIEESLRKKNYPVALLAALRLRDPLLIRSVMDAAADVEFAVKFLPKGHASVLVECAVLFLKGGYMKHKMLEYIKWAVFHHKLAIPHLAETIKENCMEEYEVLRKNYYMLRNINRRSQHVGSG